MDKISINEILLRRKNKLTITKEEFYITSDKEKAMILSIAKNIQAYGYTFSQEVFDVLFTYNKDNLIQFYKELIPQIKILVGADKVYNPMYPNFPKQVMDASDVELFFNAIIHYFTFGEVLPYYEKDERMPLLDTNSFTVLTIGTFSDLGNIFTNLVESKTSLSRQDKKDIETIIRTFSNFDAFLPETIPLKENVAFVCQTILKYNTAHKYLIYQNAISKYFKTATDVLRLITAMSDGDISLATKTKYRNFKRSERRFIMNLLANCNDILEDLFRYHYEWIRIGEIIHPFEFKAEKYKKVNDSFYALRNKKKPLFLPGKIQKAISEHRIFEATELLKNRPGEFARSLDKLLREDEFSAEYILKSFDEVASQVSVPVLLQVSQHFASRNNKNDIRVFFPKGNMAKAQFIPNDLKEIDEKTCYLVTKICYTHIIKQFQDKESMGAVYIDSEMKNFLVPFSQRSASSTNKSIVRGSKVDIKKDAEVIRAFIWWTNTKTSRVDIDLSAAMYDENWNYIDHVSYTQLRSQRLSSYHSGDITDGGSIYGDGVSEFLDVNIEAINDKARYVVFQVYSYTRQKFSDIPNCSFGWMEREDVNSGEIFEPSTVKMNLNLNTDNTTAIPVIFDCKEKQFIWCDMNIALNNLESNLTSTTKLCYAMIHLNKPNLYTLIALNAIARGYIVEDRNDADIIFSNDTTCPVAFAKDKDQNKLISFPKKDIPIITAFDIDYFYNML